MSSIDIRNALLAELISATSLPIAYENAPFDPSGLDSWVAPYFIPATSESLGKTKSSGDERRGIFQVSVFTKANDAVNYDNLQLSAIDEITSIFWNGHKATSAGQTVHILDSTASESSINGAWNQRDLTINYLAITQRV